ncbi:hypothetical protein [Streptomyces chartreusis]|uniref:hypothetical protein n=1 Tax=Streptomyces chartreusis TaxID=1969 RepID=UPI0035DDAFE2
MLIISLMLMLMGFSLSAALLDETTLAVLAGTTAIGLAGEITRRVLANSPMQEAADVSPSPTEGDPDHPR